MEERIRRAEAKIRVLKLQRAEDADLFHKQADKYAEIRPSYSSELFHFIASKTPNHKLAWDDGTDNGQAAVSLAEMYEVIVGIDTSEKQLAFTPKVANIRYLATPPTISLQDLEHLISPSSTVDHVTVAQDFHWFDHPEFYKHIHLLLCKPGGVLIVWCYTVPRVDEAVDRMFDHLYVDSRPFWEERRRLVDGEYRNVDFLFDLLREGLVDELMGSWGGEGMRIICSIMATTMVVGMGIQRLEAMLNAAHEGTLEVTLTVAREGPLIDTMAPAARAGLSVRVEDTRTGVL